jgi:hypothetical protein
MGHGDIFHRVGDWLAAASKGGPGEIWVDPSIRQNFLLPKKKYLRSLPGAKPLAVSVEWVSVCWK